MACGGPAQGVLPPDTPNWLQLRVLSCRTIPRVSSRGVARSRHPNRQEEVRPLGRQSPQSSRRATPTEEIIVGQSSTAELMQPKYPSQTNPLWQTTLFVTLFSWSHSSWRTRSLISAV